MVGQPNHAEHKRGPSQICPGQEGGKRKKKGIEQGGVCACCYCSPLYGRAAHHGALWGDRHRHEK
jgi:hypothetical protein